MDAEKCTFLLDEPFGNDSEWIYGYLRKFQDRYLPIHCVLATGVCSFGIVANVIHILVLNRPVMRKSPINILLLHIGICDLAKMILYQIYISHFLVGWHLKSVTIELVLETFSYGWSSFLWTYLCVMHILNASGLWLSAAIGLLRVPAVRKAHLLRREKSPRLFYFASITIISLTITLSLIIGANHQLVRVDAMAQLQAMFGNDIASNSTNHSEVLDSPRYYYSLQISNRATSNNCFLYKFTWFIVAFGFKLLPCILIIVLSVLIIYFLKVNAWKKSHVVRRIRLGSQGKRERRTTIAFLVIMATSLITEIPQGLCLMCLAAYGPSFNNIYSYIGDLGDLLSVLNSSINFLLYAMLSSKYRDAFWRTLGVRNIYMRHIRRIGGTFRFGADSI